MKKFQDEIAAGVPKLAGKLPLFSFVFGFPGVCLIWQRSLSFSRNFPRQNTPPLLMSPISSEVGGFARKGDKSFFSSALRGLSHTYSPSPLPPNSYPCFPPTPPPLSPSQLSPPPPCSFQPSAIARPTASFSPAPAFLLTPLPPPPPSPPYRSLSPPSTLPSSSASPVPPTLISPVLSPFHIFNRPRSTPISPPTPPPPPPPPTCHLFYPRSIQLRSTLPR